MCQDHAEGWDSFPCVPVPWLFRDYGSALILSFLPTVPHGGTSITLTLTIQE